MIHYIPIIIDVIIFAVVWGLLLRIDRIEDAVRNLKSR